MKTLKKVIPAVLWLYATLPAFGQNKEVKSEELAKKGFYQQAAKTLAFGAKLGFTTYMLTNSSNLVENSKFRLLYPTVGLFMRYQLTECFSVQGEITYTNRGGRYDENVDGQSIETDITLQYIDVPFMAVYNVRYKIFGLKSNFDLFGGIQPGFLLRARRNDGEAKNIFNNVAFDIVVGSGIPIGRVLLCAVTKITLGNLSSRLDNTIRSIGTEWTIAYKF